MIPYGRQPRSLAELLADLERREGPEKRDDDSDASSVSGGAPSASSGFSNKGQTTTATSAAAIATLTPATSHPTIASTSTTSLPPAVTPPAQTSAATVGAAISSFSSSVSPAASSSAPPASSAPATPPLTTLRTSTTSSATTPLAAEQTPAQSLDGAQAVTNQIPDTLAAPTGLAGADKSGLGDTAHVDEAHGLSASGIVVACIAGIMIIAGLSLFLYARWRKAKRAAAAEAAAAAENPTVGPGDLNSSWQQPSPPGQFGRLGEGGGGGGAKLDGGRFYSTNGSDAWFEHKSVSSYASNGAAGGYNGGSIYSAYGAAPQLGQQNGEPGNLERMTALDEKQYLAYRNLMGDK